MKYITTFNDKQGRHLAQIRGLPFPLYKGMKITIPSQDIRLEIDDWLCIQSAEKSELRITVKRTWRKMHFIHN
jgi:hypothetical protein